MERVTSQPGTIRAFEFAPLYTKVSGFVKTLKVDRGSRVKKGELLAEIYDPERDVAVIQAQASLEHSQGGGRAGRGEHSDGPGVRAGGEGQAKRGQGDARPDGRQARLPQERVRADLGAGRAQVGRRAAQGRAARRIPFVRGRGSLGARRASKPPPPYWPRPRPRSKRPRPTRRRPRPRCRSPTANLQMAKVFVQYTRIESPYDGVVIYRGESVHPGSFVRAADQGGQ